MARFLSIYASRIRMLIMLTLGASTRGDATSMAIGYPDPGGLCGKGSARCSCDDGEVVIAQGIGCAMLGEGGTPRLLSVDGPANDCSEQDVVRVELEPVRLTLLGVGAAILGGGSYARGEYLIADCCSTHSATRSRFCGCTPGSIVRLTAADGCVGLVGIDEQAGVCRG